MFPITMDPSRCLVAYMVRHGELNNMNIWDSWGSYELSEKGKESAEKAAQWLSFQRIGRAISSDMPRAIQTAQYLMDTGCVLCPFLACDPNLRPWFVGDDFTGKEKTPERIAAFKKYCDDTSLVTPGGESRDQLRDRVQVIFQYIATPYDAKPTVFFLHNSVMKSVMGIEEIKDAVTPGGVVAIWMDEKGEISFEVMLGHVAPEVGVS